MPLYEYQCEKCRQIVSWMVSTWRDADVTRFHKTDGCGGRFRRLPSITTVQFKGTGFYDTDYKKKSE